MDPHTTPPQKSKSPAARGDVFVGDIWQLTNGAIFLVLEETPGLYPDATWLCLHLQENKKVRMAFASIYHTYTLIARSHVKEP